MGKIPLSPCPLRRQKHLTNTNGSRNSVTELEILHGFLETHTRLTPTASSTFGILRILTQWTPLRRANSLTADYPVWKMVELKERIKEKGERKECKVKDRYKTPEELGKLLLCDLKECIKQDFPLSSVKGEKMRAKHKNYAHQRCAVYILREELFCKLDSFVARPLKEGILIAGERYVERVLSL